MYQGAADSSFAGVPPLLVAVDQMLAPSRRLGQTRAVQLAKSRRLALPQAHRAMEWSGDSALAGSH